METEDDIGRDWTGAALRRRSLMNLTQATGLFALSALLLQAYAATLKAGAFVVVPGLFAVVGALALVGAARMLFLAIDRLMRALATGDAAVTDDIVDADVARRATGQHALDFSNPALLPWEQARAEDNGRLSRADRGSLAAGLPEPFAEWRATQATGPLQ